MSTPQSLALVGFPPNELSAFHALFRLAARTGQGYVIVADTHEAHVVLANADDVDAVRRLWSAQPSANVLLIGQSDAGTGWPLQRRPFQLLAVLEAVRALGLSAVQNPGRPAEFAQTVPFEPSTMPAAAYAGESLAGGASDLWPAFAATEPFAPLEMPRAAPASDASGFQATQPYVPGDELPASRPAAAPAAPAPVEAIDPASIELWREARRVNSPSYPATVPAPVPAALAAIAPVVVPVAPPVPPMPPMPIRNEVRQQGADPADRADQISPAVVPEPSDDSVLVVDAGDLSRRTLERHLQQQGFRADLVRSGAEAVQQLAKRSYRLVFVNEPVADMSVFQACRAVRRQKNANGTRPAVLLVLSSQSGWFGRLRARLAGCDACLVRPFDEIALGGAMARFAAPPINA
ncbi:MAG: hypothetical protein P4L96_13180 [Rhodoferax sp.]|nr:hypothetical protein [Rhodoferax sp.]